VIRDGYVWGAAHRFQRRIGHFAQAVLDIAKQKRRSRGHHLPGEAMRKAALTVPAFWAEQRGANRLRVPRQ